MFSKLLAWIRKLLKGKRIGVDTNGDGRPDVEIIFNEKGQEIARQKLIPEK